MATQYVRASSRLGEPAGNTSSTFKEAVYEGGYFKGWRITTDKYDSTNGVWSKEVVFQEVPQPGRFDLEE